MSYIFSRALVEEYLEASCSDSAPSAPSSSNPIPQAYCSPDKMTAYSRLSRFGMTYAPLTDDRGAALLTWYLEASRARTFQPQEKAPALTAPAPASGGKCTELSMRYDRNSHSWKTHLCLWDEDLPESSVILPKSGTMRNGLCWERTMWEPRTSESASGYLHMIPTPTACNAPHQGDVRGDGELSENERPGSQGNYHAGRAETNDCGEWWSAEPDVGRVAHGVAGRVDRIKAIGNGQVPAVAATAFRVLLGRFQEGKEGNESDS